MKTPQTAVIVSTYHHTMEGEGLKNLLSYNNQNFDNFFVLFDNKLNKQQKEVSEAYGKANICLYNEVDFNNNNFNRPISSSHHWGKPKNSTYFQNPNYFYAHHRMMIFYLKNPNFDYYWFFDDDVTFMGNLNEFIQSYQNYMIDFLAIQMFKKEDYGNELPHVSKINERMWSGGHWLSYAPGPGDNYKTTERHLGSFFPVVRFSAKALTYLIEVNKEGYFGYSEGFVPTTIASTPGFKVASILNENDEYFLPSTVNCEIKHKGLRFDWTLI